MSDLYFMISLEREIGENMARKTYSSLFLHSQVRKSAKTNHHEKVHEDKKTQKLIAMKKSCFSIVRIIYMLKSLKVVVYPAQL